MDRAAFVYLLTNTITGKCYIGICASKVQRRWRRHCNSAAANKPRNRNCPALHGAIRKYGEAVFTIETLYEAVNWQEACKVERGLIAQYGTMAPNGYNLTAGGEGNLGCKFSDEERSRRSTAVKGKPLSAEHRAKIGAAHRGVPKSPEHIARMVQGSLKWRSEPENKAMLREKSKSPERAAIARVNMQKAIASNFGRSPGAETRAKMSAWQIGKRHSEETKAKIAAKARARYAEARGE